MESDRPTLFLSDLHLPPEPSPLREAFIGFIEGPAAHARTVYILGDLFEYWIGDDVGLQVYAGEVAALAGLSARGVQVFFQRGNRDFLVGEGFAQITGVQLLDDPKLIELYGTPTLISHGDLFCTEDRGYQRWRRFSRNRLAQALFLKLPRSSRARIAGQVRAESDRAKHLSAESIMDVNPMSVARSMKDAGVRHLIHGHTHRPQLHRTSDAERIVLADWRPEHREFLAVDASGFRRVVLPAAS